MSSGRGRGYTGRHRQDEAARPGDERSDSSADLDSVPDLNPLLAELNPLQLDLNAQAALYDGLNDNGLLNDIFDTTEDEQLKELLHIDEHFKPLLVLLEQFTPGEDGIQFNRKLRHFESTVTNMCPDEIRLHKAFATFRAAALTNSSTARKLAAVGASFTRQQRQLLLRTALLNVVLQGTYAKLDVLERAQPQYLINAANLIGDYFAEARLCNGKKVHILAGPLLDYMKALLTCNEIKAHRGLATQLMQNGRELLTVLSQKLDELSIAIRVRLLSPPPSSVIWLLLSADLCLNKFLPLPNILQHFYASQLELANEEDNPNYYEMNYGSWKASPEKEDFKNVSLPDTLSELNISTDKANHSLSQLNLSHEDGLDVMKPKLRPILGAGAGLLRQENQPMNHSVSQDTYEAWSNKTSLMKRYDLNSWRANDDDVKELEEPVFNPSVMPPNLTSSYPPTIIVPDYPPPNITQILGQNNVATPETFPSQNYLQQGDGKYIQNQFNERFNANTSFSQGDGMFVNSQQFLNQSVEKSPPPQNSNVTVVQNETQKTPNPDRSRRPVESWRKEKNEPKEDTNKNRPKTWTRQKSKESVDDGDEENEEEIGARSSSRSSKEGRQERKQSKKKEEASPDGQKTAIRRHVTDVPRSQKYWDHDDRCDKDYNS